jgi:hypothetical protein
VRQSEHREETVTRGRVILLKEDDFGGAWRRSDSHVQFLLDNLRWRIWLRHYATSWKVAGSIPGVIENFSLT